VTVTQGHLEALDPDRTPTADSLRRGQVCRLLGEEQLVAALVTTSSELLQFCQLLVHFESFVWWWCGKRKTAGFSGGLTTDSCCMSHHVIRGRRWAFGTFPFAAEMGASKSPGVPFGIVIRCFIGASSLSTAQDCLLDADPSRQLTDP
jgi:hypothetical protein